MDLGVTLGLLVATFTASFVEFVEALTIVLAMGATRSWRSALSGVAAAVAALAAFTLAATPERAERQLRVAPIASTMVSASTNSTKDAVKVATSRPSVTPRSIRQAYRRRRPATRRWRPRPCRRS